MQIWFFQKSMFNEKVHNLAYFSSKNEICIFKSKSSTGHFVTIRVLFKFCHNTDIDNVLFEQFQREMWEKRDTNSRKENVQKNPKIALFWTSVETDVLLAVYFILLQQELFTEGNNLQHM